MGRCRGPPRSGAANQALQTSVGYVIKDVTDKIEHPSTFIGPSLWVNRRSWPRKPIGHRVLLSIYRSFTIRPRLSLKTFVGDVIKDIFAAIWAVPLICSAC